MRAWNVATFSPKVVLPVPPTTLPKEPPVTSLPRPLTEFASDESTELLDRLEAELPHVALMCEQQHAEKQWPPRGVSMVNYYFNADSTLSKTSSDNAQIDTYSRDLRAGTGWTNRWWTQIGRPVHYKDRKKDQEYLLTYTTPKLTAPTEITGHPILNLSLSSETTDAMVFVYLESVDELGNVHYLTEGQLRLLHRKLGSAPHPHGLEIPYHTYKKEDALPMTQGKTETVKIALLPTSVQVPKGHRLRVSIALHDRYSFAKLPAWGTTKISISKSNEHPSFIELPVMGRNMR